jgi:hypothetical protein
VEKSLELKAAGCLGHLGGVAVEDLLRMSCYAGVGWLISASIPLTDAVAPSQHAGLVEGFSVEFDLLDLLRAVGSRRRMGLGAGLGLMGAERKP